MVPSIANYAEWFTCSSRFHFLKEGYAFLSFELAQVEEPGFPTDRLLTDGNRVVGMRFLRSVEAVAGQRAFAYSVDDAIRTRMAEAGPWLLYALPLSADPLDQQLTHQKVAFAGVAEVASDVSGHLGRGAYALFQGVGRRHSSQESTAGKCMTGRQAGMFLATAREGGATLYLVLNHRERTVIVLGNHRR